MKFYEKLKNLAAHEIGRVVEEVINKCPSAFKEVDDENAQIILDNMSAPIFTQINFTLDQIFEESVDRITKKQKIQ